MARLNLRRDAFSLVELLVCMMLIALLVALLLPALAAARRSVYDAGCLAKLQQLGLATRAYAHDHKGVLPVAAHDTGSGAVGYPQPVNVQPDSHLYSPYLPISTAWDGPFMCPTYLHDGREPRVQNQAATALKVSYTYNLRVGGYFEIDRWTYPQVRWHHVRKPSLKAYLVDGLYRNEQKIWYARHDTPMIGPSGAATDSAPMDRHLGGRNHLLYFDNHVAAITGAELLARKMEIWHP